MRAPVTANRTAKEPGHQYRTFVPSFFLKSCSLVAEMGGIKNLILVFLSILLTALLLRRLLGVYAIIVPLLYMFFDVNWSLRVTWIVLKKVILGRKTNHNFLDVSETTFIVLPSDMDLNLHMNNAR